MYSEDIAKVCYEVNRAACAAFGDHSQPAWEDVPDWQRESTIKGVEFTLANPEAKTHPCFVPYDELPPEQKLKDYLFQAVVRSVV
jgi:hypothetical protein